MIQFKELYIIAILAMSPFCSIIASDQEKKDIEQDLVRAAKDYEQLCALEAIGLTMEARLIEARVEAEIESFQRKITNQKIE